MSTDWDGVLIRVDPVFYCVDGVFRQVLVDRFVEYLCIPGTDKRLVCIQFLKLRAGDLPAEAIVIV